MTKPDDEIDVSVTIHPTQRTPAYDALWQRLTQPLITHEDLVEFAKWPSARDAARQLGYSVMHISRLVRSGKLHAVRTRVGWLIDPESVAAYEADHSSE